jgi:uncharacterized RDD family membrane protein YckC
VCAILAANIGVSAMGFWQMKKQGFYVYLIYAVLSQMYFYTHNTGGGASLVFSVIVIILGAVNLEEMDGHERLNGTGRSFKCDKCGAEMKNEMALNMHKRSCGNSSPSVVAKAGVARPGSAPVAKASPPGSVSSANPAAGATGRSAAAPAASRSLPGRPSVPGMPARPSPSFPAAGMSVKSSFVAPGPNKRVCAYLIDMALLMIVARIANFGPLITFAIQIVFTLFRDSIDGQGPGKRFAGLMVEDENGEVALPQACAIRNATLALPPVLLLVGTVAGFEAPGMLFWAGVLVVEYAMTRNREDGRRIGDMLAGTRVCDRSAEIGDGRFFWYSLLAVIISSMISAGNQADIGGGRQNSSGRPAVKSAARTDWQKFKSAGGTYSVMLPGAAREVDQEVAEGNMKIMTRLVNLKVAGMEYVIMTMKFPNSIENVPLDRMFEGGKANLLANPADKLEDEKKIHSGIHEGREYRVALDKPRGAKLWGRIYINVKGQIMIMAMVQYGRDDFDAESVSRFLDSIEIH